MSENIILGAGIAGLGAAYASGFQYPIYESTGHAGGLCSGFEIQGFQFDRAVHLSFTESDIVRGVFDITPHYCYHPYPRSWYYDRWIKHPVQNNLNALPVEKRVSAIEGFVKRPHNIEPANFKDWNISRYGRFISEEFVFPYNSKYWCESLEKIGVSWIGNRLYQPSLAEVLTGSYIEDTENTYYAKEMRYPIHGGFEAFLSETIQNSKLIYRKHVSQIDGKSKTVYFSDGTKIYYQTAFSSIPLVEMSGILKDAPIEVRQASQMLNYTGVVLVSVGLRGEKVLDDIWFYIYDKDIWAARVYSPSNKSPNNAPQGYSSLQFEIYFNGRTPPPAKEECIQNIKYALKRLAEHGAICIDIDRDIVFMDCRVQNYGNIIMYPNNEAKSQTIKDYLKSIDVIPIGRFGEWKYFWSDQAFLSGYNNVKMRENNL